MVSAAAGVVMGPPFLRLLPDYITTTAAAASVPRRRQGYAFRSRRSVLPPS